MTGVEPCEVARQFVRAYYNTSKDQLHCFYSRASRFSRIDGTEPNTIRNDKRTGIPFTSSDERHDDDGSGEAGDQSPVSSPPVRLHGCTRASEFLPRSMMMNCNLIFMGQEVIYTAYIHNFIMSDNTQ